MAEFAAVAIVLIAGEMCHVFIVPLFSLEGSIQSKQFRFVWNVLEKKNTIIFCCPRVKRAIACVLLLRK